MTAIQAVEDDQQPAVALSGTGMTRQEVRLMHRDSLPMCPQIDLAGTHINPTYRAAAVRTPAHHQIALAVGLAHVTVIDARQFARTPAQHALGIGRIPRRQITT